MPQLVSSLLKLGMPPNATLENRRLALDLAALVLHWERQSLAAAPQLDIQASFAFSASWSY